MHVHRNAGPVVIAPDRKDFALSNTKLRGFWFAFHLSTYTCPISRSQHGQIDLLLSQPVCWVDRRNMISWPAAPLILRHCLLGCPLL